MIGHERECLKNLDRRDCFSNHRRRADEGNRVTGLNELCTASRIAAVQLRSALYARSRTPELLNAFGGMQDQIHRLIAHLRDHPGELLDFRLYGLGVIRSAVGVLSITRKEPVYRLPAVREACARINESLIELEYLKERKHSRGASSTS